jgi:tetratricopeptide (TPR) repeat protein
MEERKRLMAHPSKVFFASFALLFCLSLPLLSAASSAAADMKDGIDSFRNGQYDKAILHLHNVILDSSAGPEKPAAYLLIAKAYMAIGRLDDAERNVEFYLATYEKEPDYQEALYQKGRLLFLQEDYENAVKSLQGFITAWPKSPFVPSAWFWVGESLYGLGRLDDARAMYQKIVSDYPTSIKVEAAQYKLALIQLQRKEVELSKLLKWSHEDFLKSMEEYQNREKTYEQAIAAYQRRITGTGAGEDLKTIAELRQQLARKTDEANQLTAQLARLGGAPAPQAAAAPAAGGSARLQRLLAAKAQALALKERYLEALEPSGGMSK